MIKHTFALLRSILISWFFLQTIAIQSCSNPQATLYDGYLDPFISYGSFSQNENSYFQFGNPFKSTSSLTSSTVAFWALFPNPSTTASLQLGRFLDCSETISVKMMNDTVYYQAMSSTFNSTTSVNSTVSASVFKNNLPLQQQWNHFAFFFTSKTMMIAFNGVVVSTQSTPLTQLNSSTSTCSIGNSIAMQEPLNVYLRHFLFSKLSYSSSLNLTNIIHHITQPTDPNALAYFKFSHSFNFEETYYNSPTKNFVQNNVAIQQANSPEFVCFCQGTYPSYLNVTTNYVLTPVNLSSSTSSRIDNSGVYLDFQIYPQQNSLTLSNVQDQILVSIQNYVNIVLTNQSNTIRVDLYNYTGSLNNSLLFTNYRFRFNYWTEYSVNITKTSVSLTIDGNFLQTISHKVSLPNFNGTSSSSFMQMPSPSSLSYLVSYFIISNQQGKLLYNASYSQSQITAANYTSSTPINSSGSIQFGSNSQLCSPANAQAQTYWTGYNCINNRLSPYFNKRNQSSSSYVLGNLQSSTQDMTVSMWLRDYSSSLSVNQVVFENSVDGVNPLLQISSTTVALLRTLTCNPQAAVSPPVYTQLMGQSAFSVWNHFSCVSSSALQQIKIVYYTPSSLSYKTSVQNGVAFQDYPGQNLITALGSSVNGLNKFQGQIRAFQIWNTPQTEYFLSLYRYLMQSSAQQNLVYYFKLGDQINPWTLQDSQNNQNQMLEQSLNTPEIDYTQDVDLIMCQPGLYYNGQCCMPFSLTGVNFDFNYVSTNFFNVSVDTSQLQNQFLAQSIKANFSILTVYNNFQFTYQNQLMNYSTYLSQLFNQNQVVQFQVSTNLVTTLAYSITIQALIYSDYQPSTQVTLTQTLVLQCPILWLNIIPNIFVDTTQIVSQTSFDAQPTIYATAQTQCWNMTTAQPYTPQGITPLNWNFNATKAVFTNEFLITNQTMTVVSVQNKSNLTGANAYLKVSASMGYISNKVVQEVTNSINLYYAPIQVNTSSLQTQYQVLQGDSLTIDLTEAYTTSASSAYSSTAFNYLTSSCPFSIFENNMTEYDELCIGNSPQQGYYSLDTSQITPVINYPYNFSFQFGVPNTSIIQDFSVGVQFYQDGSSQTPCPYVQFDSSLYQYTMNSGVILQFTPDPYFYCDSTYYSIQSANWTVTNTNNQASDILLLSYGSQQEYLIANMTPASAKAYAVAGQSYDIGVTFNLISQQGQQAQAQATTTLQILESALVPQVVAYGDNKTVLANNALPFINMELILDASSSYDPDSNQDILAFAWACPDVVEIYYDCSTLQRGNQSQQLYLNALQRAKIGFQYKVNYTFYVTVTSVSNQNKLPVTFPVNVSFNPPLKTDYKTNFDMAPQCEQMGVVNNGLSVYSMSSTYSKVLRYDILNYTTANLNISFTNANSCKNGNVTEQVMFFYAYENNFFPSGEPIEWVFEQNETTQILNTDVLNFPVSQFPINAIPPTILYQSSIYWFTQRATSGQDEVFLNIDTVYYVRNYAQLQAVLTNGMLTVDKYSSLVLNASLSYDPENLGNNYTFKWTCPGSVSSCSGQASPILTVGTNSRTNGQSNTNSSSYLYSVVMQDSSTNRTSPPAYANVTITQLSSYAYCINLQFTSDLLANYWTSTNQTVFFQYGQSQLINAVMGVTAPTCPFVNIETTSWYTNSNVTYWTNDTGDNGININGTTALKYIKTGATTPTNNSVINFKQRYSLGADTSIKYYAYNYLNVQIVPPYIQSVVKGPQISYFNQSNLNKNITLSAASSVDPLGGGISDLWYSSNLFQGQTLPNTSLALTYTNLNAMLSPSIVENYYDIPNPISLQQITTSTSKSINRQDFLFLASNSSDLYMSGIESCGINLTLSQSSYTQLPFSTGQVFTFTCSNQTLQNYLLQSQSVTWSIDQLNSTFDYFQDGQSLFLMPYRASIIPSTQIYVGITFNNQLMGGPIKAAFTMMNPDLQQGSITPLPSDKGVAYGEFYQLQFQQFTALYEMQFQMRGYYSQYGSYQIIFPIKSYLNQYQQALYGNMLLPQVEELYIDFFDQFSNYIGSYSLTNETFPDIQLGQISQDQFEQWLTQYSSNSYKATIPSKAQFESDLHNIKCLSEALLLNVVQFYDTTQIPTYASQFLSFVVNNFQTMYSAFNNSNANDIASKVQLDRKTVYLLNNILQIASNQQQVLALYTSNNNVSGVQNLNLTLQVLQTIVNDYSIMTADGDEQIVLRQYLIQIFSNLDPLISGFPSSLQKVLSNLESTVVGQLFSGLSKGQMKNFFQGNSFMQTLLLQNNPSSPNQTATFQSQINPNELVIINNQSLLVSQANINSLEVTYAVSQNTTLPTDTILYINAYNANNQRQSVNFYDLDLLPNDTVYSFQYQLQALPSYLPLFEDSTLTPFCAFLSETLNEWSSEGVLTTGYNMSTGIINCQAYHLSTFSFIYNSPLIISSGNTTNGTGNATILDYFQSNKGGYGAVVGVCGGILFICLGTAFINRTNWDNQKPNIAKLKTDYSLGQTIKASLLLNHHLIAPYIGPQNGNKYLTMSRPNKLIISWTIFFAMALIVEIVLMKGVSISWTVNNQVSLGVIVVVVVHFLRIPFINLIYGVYFLDLVPEEKFVGVNDLINQQDATRNRGAQYEGGESEDEDESEHKKQRDSAYKKDDGPYNGGANRANVSSDIEIDSIEMEIERSNKNGFFQNQNRHRGGQQSQRNNDNKGRIDGHNTALNSIDSNNLNLKQNYSNQGDSKANTGLVIDSSLHKPAYNSEALFRAGEGDKVNTTDKPNHEVSDLEGIMYGGQGGLKTEMALTGNVQLDSVRVNLNANDKAAQRQVFSQQKPPQPTKEVQPKSNKPQVRGALDQERSFIGTLFINLVILFLLAGLAFGYMWKGIADKQDMHHWVGIILGSYFTLVLILDTLFIILFAIVYHKTGQYSKATRWAGFLLVGNVHRNLVYGLIYQLNM